MTPATVHLNAQLIRHFRGVCTAFEKWADSPDATIEELQASIVVWRGMLAMVEQQVRTLETGRPPAVVARAG